MKSFFWGYGDETPGSVEPSGEPYESLRTLEALLAQGGAGALTLPHVGTLQAVLTELEGEQEPRENFVRYRFTFVEAA